MTARDRFKAMLANALERVCILEEELEAAQARIGELLEADAAVATGVESESLDNGASTVASATVRNNESQSGEISPHRADRDEVCGAAP